MIAFLVEHNFNEHIVDGLTRRDPTLEFTHVRDVDLAAAPIRKFSNGQPRIVSVLLTHDRKTVPPLAQARVAEGLPMPGSLSPPRRSADRPSHQRVAHGRCLPPAGGVREFDQVFSVVSLCTTG